MTRAAVLLAAGASRRFGAEDKLLAPLNGQPLVLHAAQVLRALPVERHLAVVSSHAVGDRLRGVGLEVITIPPGRGQAASLVAAVSRLREETHLLVMLGDMPFLRADDVTPLLEADPDSPHGSRRDGIGPPAIFPAAWFPRLAALTGDEGAGRLLRALPPEAHLPVPASALRDIDTPDDLARAAAGEGRDFSSGA